MLIVAFGAAAGVGLVIWMSGAGVSQVSAIAPTLRMQGVEPPRPATGLIERPDNRGQVLFGRYCDSCHTAGREVLGSSLRSAQFKRQFNTEQKIAKVTREGGFDMPAYPKSMVSDEDLALIAAYVQSLPQESR
jgi:mono/diheme cytochrome c family protein